MDVSTILLLAMFAALLASILSGMPAMVAIGGAPLLVAGIGIALGSFDPAFLHAYPQRVFGMMGNQLFIALPLFIFIGILMEKAGLAQGMLSATNRLGGGSRRNLGLSVLLVSALIAATTGIVGATIVMLGAISYPALVRSGVSQKLASGLVISAGTLGQIIPPSIVLIILADQISNAYQEAQRANGIFAVEPVTVSDLFAGAMLPGLLLAVLYTGYFVFANAKEERENKALPLPQTTDEFSSKEAPTALVFLLAPLFLILGVLGSIVFGIATPTEAAAVGAVGTLFLSALGNEYNNNGKRRTLAVQAGLVAMVLLIFVRFVPEAIQLPIVAILCVFLIAGMIISIGGLIRSNVLKPVLIETIILSGMIFGIVLAASLLSLVFRGFGGDLLLAELAANLPGEKWGALFAVMLIVFLLGFFLEFIEIVFIVVPIAGPILLGMDIDPVWFAVLLALNLQTSFLTPPFGVALFYFRSVAPRELKTSTLYSAVIPFVILQLIALLTVAIFPKIALVLPHWLLG